MTTYAAKRALRMIFAMSTIAVAVFIIAACTSTGEQETTTSKDNTHILEYSLADDKPFNTVGVEYTKDNLIAKIVDRSGEVLFEHSTLEPVRSAQRLYMPLKSTVNIPSQIVMDNQTIIGHTPIELEFDTIQDWMVESYNQWQTEQLAEQQARIENKATPSPPLSPYTTDLIAIAMQELLEEKASSFEPLSFEVSSVQSLITDDIISEVYELGMSATLAYRLTHVPDRTSDVVPPPVGPTQKINYAYDFFCVTHPLTYDKADMAAVIEELGAVDGNIGSSLQNNRRSEWLIPETTSDQYRIDVDVIRTSTAAPCGVVKQVQ